MTSLMRTKRWLKYRFSSRALILMYHRVTELATDPFLLTVTPQHFAEQLDILRKYMTPIRLQQLVQALQHGKVPNRAVVLTFDDGYTDNLYQAKPQLEYYEIPATVFVTAGRVGSQQEFWWDELDRLLMQPGRLPYQLRLNIAGVSYEWVSSEGETYSKQDYQRNRGWHIERPDHPNPRHRLFRDLFEKLISLPDQERQRTLENLRAWSGAELAARPTHRAMTSEELHLLVKEDLIEVGAHTMTHPSLAELAVSKQRDEIQQSKTCLEEILKRPVKTFAYPNGSTTRESAALLQEAGFIAACSSNADAVWRDAAVFCLPRLGVRDWDQKTFMHWLKYWMDG